MTTQGRLTNDTNDTNDTNEGCLSTAKPRGGRGGSFAGVLVTFNTTIPSNGMLFDLNTAQENGGAVYVEDLCTVSFDDAFTMTVKVTNNDAQKGGAVYNAGSVVSEMTEFTSNSATEGGAIYMVSGAHLTSVGDSFISNTADDGAGVYFKAPMITAVEFRDAVFNGNTAISEGGAIYADSANLDQLFVTDSAFTDNTDAKGWEFHDPIVDAVYTSNITNISSYSSTYQQAYNGFDIGGLVANIQVYNLIPEVYIVATKNPVGGLLPGAGEFEFEIYDDQGNVEATGTNDEDGHIEFIIRDVDTRALPKTFTMEETVAPAGWTQDTSVKTLILEATWLPDGSQGVHVSYVKDDPTDAHSTTPIFINQLESDECGLVEFPELTFTVPGVYTYTIKEQTKFTPGWDTDWQTEFTVTITVEEDPYGNLVATADYGNDFPTFVNVKTGANGKYQISACKRGVGAGLIDGKFTFGLFNSQNVKVAEATNGPASAHASPASRELLAYVRKQKRKCGTITHGTGDVTIGSSPKHALQLDKRTAICESNDAVLLMRAKRLQDKIDCFAGTNN